MAEHYPKDHISAIRTLVLLLPIRVTQNRQQGYLKEQMEKVRLEFYKIFG